MTEGMYTDRALGVHGFKELGVGAHDGDWGVLVPDGGAATFSATSNVGDNLSSRERSEGVYGDFSAVDVTAGFVRAYWKTAQD